jgi:hypothetical protein
MGLRLLLGLALSYGLSERSERAVTKREKVIFATFLAK